MWATGLRNRIVSWNFTWFEYNRDPKGWHGDISSYGQRKKNTIVSMNGIYILCQAILATFTYAILLKSYKALKGSNYFYF